MGHRGRGLGGPGSRICRHLVRQGLNLLLVARRPSPLSETAARLRASGGVEIRTLSADLGTAQGLDEIAKAARDLEIGLLVHNAASSYEGPYFNTNLAKYRHVVDVNCFSALALIDLAAGKMIGRGRGGIIVMSSMAAFQGSPYVTVYSATKAFLLSLAEGLAVEMKPKGVDVLACCPAVVRTPNYLASMPAGAKATPVDVEPDVVAREALRALAAARCLFPAQRSGWRIAQ